MTTEIRTIEDINAALDRIASAMTDKGILGPKPDIKFTHGWQLSGWLHADSLIGGENYVHFYGSDATIVTDDMLAHVVALKSADEERIAKWQKDLAHVIDEGHDLNLPNNVLDPLRTSSQSMTENLLEVAR